MKFYNTFKPVICFVEAPNYLLSVVEVSRSLLGRQEVKLFDRIPNACITGGWILRRRVCQPLLCKF